MRKLCLWQDRNLPEFRLFLIVFLRFLNIFLGKYGQLTYVRVYQGTVAIKDDMINTRTGKRTQVKRLVQMHSDKMEDIKEVSNILHK